jgi:hypothetical protein
MTKTPKKVKIPKSKQTLFNKVVRHLLTQKDQSTSGGNCCYRSPDGLKCAAGCLLPDDFDFERYNRDRWSSLVEQKLVSGLNYKLICDLQEIHDSKRIVAWPSYLAALARTHKLKIPVILKKALQDPCWERLYNLYSNHKETANGI